MASPISDHLLNLNPVAFELDEGMFAKVRSARKGAAPGPSGMAVEHLRPLLDNPRDVHMFFLMAEQLVQGRAPEVAVQAIRLVRLTALRKPDGGVRGIVVGTSETCHISFLTCFVNQSRLRVHCARIAGVDGGEPGGHHLVS